MAQIIVYTDEGVPVHREEGIDAHCIGAVRSSCHARASALVGGLQRAVQDAEAISAGRSPLRLSERAMHAAFSGAA